jgi:hypothetical protein
MLYSFTITSYGAVDGDGLGDEPTDALALADALAATLAEVEGEEVGLAVTPGVGVALGAAGHAPPPQSWMLLEMLQVEGVLPSQQDEQPELARVQLQPLMPKMAAPPTTGESNTQAVGYSPAITGAHTSAVSAPPVAHCCVMISE